MFHPSEAGRDVDMQREGSRGQAKRLFLSDVVSFPSRIFTFHKFWSGKSGAWQIIFGSEPSIGEFEALKLRSVGRVATSFAAKEMS